MRRNTNSTTKTLMAALGVALLASVGCAETATPDGIDTAQVSVAAASTVDDHALGADLATSLEQSTSISDITTNEVPTRVVDLTRTIREVEVGMVGLHVRPTEEPGFVVVEVFANTPAEASGLQAGERVVAVDGMDADMMSLREFVGLVRGAPGASVELTVVSRDGEERVLVMDRAPTVLTATPEQQRRAVIMEREFGGVGIGISRDAEGVRVVQVMDGLPAASSGLTVGDRIVAVDGLSTEDANAWEVSGFVRGDAGTPVMLTVEGLDGATRELSVERATIALPEGGHGCY